MSLRGAALACMLSSVASLALPLSAQSSPSRGPQTYAVSVGEGGHRSNGPSYAAAISGSGRFVAFASRGSNLISGDDNGRADVFVKDTVSGALELISRSAAGEPGDHDSELPSVSANGRHVAFLSSASNLAPGFGWLSVYLHDRAAGSTIPVSRGPNGEPANSVSGNPTVSGSGASVVFYSWASNLVPGDTNGTMDTFVYDARREQIERVSVGVDGTQANGMSYPAWFHGSISSDGRFVAYVSSASNLVAGDDPGTWDAYVFDRATRRTRRVSERDGIRIPGSSENVVISPDGSVAAFVQARPAVRAEPLGTGIGSPDADIFLVDLANGDLELISDPLVSPGVMHKDMLALSGDGRFVAYSSKAPLQTAIDAKGRDNVFLYDHIRGTTSLVSASSEGLPAVGGDSVFPSISHDGKLISFSSSSPTLAGQDRKICFVHGAPGLCSDVFLRDRGSAYCTNGSREEGSVSRMVAGSRPHLPAQMRRPLLGFGCALAGAGA